MAGPDGPGAPIRAAAAAPVLHLLGAALSPQDGETLEVIIDGAVAAGVHVVSDSELSLSAPSQRAGLHTARVLRQGAPIDQALSATRPAASSAPVNFTVLPTLATATAHTASHHGGESTGHLDATVAPALDPTQRVRLLMDSQTLDPPFAVAVPITIAASTNSISGHYADVPTDDYRVTLEVDGVRSIPEVDAADHYVLPVVTL